MYDVDQDGAELAVEMLAWSRDVVLCTHGRSAEMPQELLERLRRTGVRVIESPVTRLEGSNGQLECVHFEDGNRLARRALFFSSPQHQQSGLPKALGCRFEDDGTVKHTGSCEAMNMPCLFVAGNASACGGPQLAIVAAAQGAEAAHVIHCGLAEGGFTRGGSTRSVATNNYGDISVRRKDSR